MKEFSIEEDHKVQHLLELQCSVRSSADLNDC